MAEYKLIHFNTRFLAEPIRYIFAFAEIPYEDVRIPFGDWKDMKDGMPWNQLPILELRDGRQLGQSSAIAEYLARKYNLTGLDDWDESRCTEVSDSMRDVRQEWRKFYFQRNRDRQNEMRKVFIDKVVPKYFGQLAKMQADSGSDYLICEVITWADLLLAHSMAFFQETVDPACFDAYPNLLTLKDKIYETRQIKKWLAERPKPDLRMLSMVPVSV